MKSDPGLYDYWPYVDRPKLTWPGGARVAFWVAPNIEFYEFNPPANPYRKPWPRPNPDVLGYSLRDYGNRAGIWRMMEAMDRCGVRGSISLNVALCDHHPEIIEACAERDWEFFSHGIYNTRYCYDMDEAQERELIEDAFATVEKHTGTRLAGWLSPALTNTERTLDLLAEHGIKYTCDLFQDDQPQPLNFYEQWQEVPDNQVFENGFKVQWEAFIRHLFEDAPWSHGLLEGAKGVQLAELGMQSWAQRRWVEVPELSP